MEQTIYGDVLFAINFSMDFLALFLTAKIMRLAASARNLIFAAAAGAAYGVAAVFFTGSGYIELALHIAVSLLMCFIVFGCDKKLMFARAALLFWMVSFALGGSMTALYNLFRRSSGAVYMDGSGIAASGGMPAGSIIILAALSAGAVLVTGRIASKRKRVRSVHVKAVYGGQNVEFDCLCDSGNLLSEPVGGRPVIVTRYETLEPILPDALKPVFENGDASRLENVPLSLARRVRLVPVSAVGGKGIIAGLIPDSVEVGGVARDVCLAVDNGPSHDYGGYPAVAPAELT